MPNGPSCPVIVQSLFPCLDFIRGRSAIEALDKPSQSCCSGVKSISDQIKTRKDRTEACECLKQALSGIGSYDPKKFPQLSKECGASQEFPPIDRNTDCPKALLLP
ncbi:hypothetical protein QQ045_010636 [Rhodiola kirilowii]